MASSVTYTVRRGDTLSKIAARYGTTWQALFAINKGRSMPGGRTFTNPNLIIPGQVLIIRRGSSPSTPTTTTKPKPTSVTTTTSDDGKGMLLLLAAGAALLFFMNKSKKR